METPRNLKYTKSHEWVRFDGKIATVGITDFAQDQLSDLTYVELPTVGDEVGAAEGVGAVGEEIEPPAGVGRRVAGRARRHLGDHR